jgi:hypothetical protein
MQLVLVEFVSWMDYILLRVQPLLRIRNVLWLLLLLKGWTSALGSMVGTSHYTEVCAYKKKVGFMFCVVVLWLFVHYKIVGKKNYLSG